MTTAQSYRSIKRARVCVVGGAGFLGSHLVNHLIDDRQCQVTVIDNLCAGRREFVHGEAEFIHHDITQSEEFLSKVFASRQIDYVFNYAAWPYIPDSFERPLQVFNVNAMGALKVINAAQSVGVKGILQVSSAEIYGDAGTPKCLSKSPNDGPQEPFTCAINENGEVKPHSSYGAAKAAIDALIQVRWKEAQTPCIALRQFNCIGERETHPYIVPEIINQFATCQALGTPPTLRLGNNSQRDFLYAGDAVRMAVELLESGNFGEVYNMGSESAVHVYQLGIWIGELMGFHAGDIRIITEESRCRPWEIWHLQSDNRKLYEAITYRPAVNLKEALRLTVEGFERSLRRWSWT